MIEPAIGFQCENQEQAGNAEMNGSNSAKRILMVEDDNDLREMIGEMLEYSGHAANVNLKREWFDDLIVNRLFERILSEANIMEATVQIIPRAML